jgi:hypothetical protein
MISSQYYIVALHIYLMMFLCFFKKRNADFLKTVKEKDGGLK